MNSVWLDLSFQALLDSLVVDSWLRVWKVPGSIHRPRTASYHRRYKNGTGSSLVWHSTLKREILALSEELRYDKKCPMDNG